ncbi:MAG: translation initiation factor IF-3 [Planctomycetota bacterium]
MLEFGKEVIATATQNYRVNEMIRIRQVRLIDEKGEQLGLVDTDEAKRLARERGLDLVEVAPSARPPVCKIMDFGKFKYAQQKKERESKKKQHVVLIKEIRLRPKIGKHDADYKVRKAKEFLEEGHKVQVNMLFRGREMAHQDVAEQVMLTFYEALKDIAKIERAPRLEGRRMIMMLTKA